MSLTLGMVMSFVQVDRPVNYFVQTIFWRRRDDRPPGEKTVFTTTANNASVLRVLSRSRTNRNFSEMPGSRRLRKKLVKEHIQHDASSNQSSSSSCPPNSRNIVPPDQFGGRHVHLSQSSPIF